jgi:lipase chaperone LimK
MITSRTMRWAGHVERMGEIRNAYNFFLGSLEERNHSKDLSVGRRIILKWILGK